MFYKNASKTIYWDKLWCNFWVLGSNISGFKGKFMYSGFVTKWDSNIVPLKNISDIKIFGDFSMSLLLKVLSIRPRSPRNKEG